MSDIASRLLSRIGCEDLLDRLRALPGSDLNSLLLEIYRMQAGKADAAAVVKSHAGSRFTGPSGLDPAKYYRLEADLTELAHRQGMTPVLLSPVAPLGSCSAFGCVSQNNVISAARAVEVLADPSNMLAIIIADQYKRGLIDQDAPRHFCAAARVARAQLFSRKNLLAHFGLFCIVSSGRDTGAYACEQALITGQLAYYKEMFETKYRAGLSITLRKRMGYPDGDGFFDRLHGLIQSQMPAVPITVETGPSDNEYYKGLNFKIYMRTPEALIEVGDGGFVDWMHKATGNKKQRCLISGIGLDRLMSID